MSDTFRRVGGFLLLQRAGQLRRRREAMGREILGDAAIDRLADQRIVEQRSTDSDRRRSGNHELERITRAGDTALTDDRNAVRAGSATSSPPRKSRRRS